ncbi:MAG TPA: NADH:flavin oxidoreductase/NADH oxidase [Anaerolineaceae bacterium]|nr:NADH:flavin oxidoreductase/NADH oxidase [Anaerolineaceae bacterium]
MTHLFDPLKIKNITLRNRVGVSPMCQYSYTDGFSNDWQLVHLGTRAVGGAGLIIAEATAVEARGRITPFDVGIWSDAHIEPLRRVVKVVKENGAVPGIQIAHAGRKACVGQPWTGGKPVQPVDSLWWPVVGASPIAFSQEHQVPHELTIEEIAAIRRRFVEGAERSLEAGFEWLEVHGAHGYLLQSFCSPLSNRRSDQYGGPLENRARFLLEVVRDVRRVWPERLPLTVRISGTEWVKDGWSVDDSVTLARLLKEEGVDLIDCSSAGNLASAPVPTEPCYQVHIAEAVRRGAGIPTAAVGLITTALQAEEIISSGRADLVLLGREMLRTPYWAVLAAKELGQPAPIPPQYLRAL